VGKISQYQRSKMNAPSQKAPLQDRSGEIIAEGAKELGRAFMARQEALDRTAVVQKEYELQRKYSSQRGKLQQQYADNPEEFTEQDDIAYSNIFNETTRDMPKRLKTKFTEVTNQSRSQRQLENDKWVFNTQNENALSSFTTLTEDAIADAGMITSAHKLEESLNKYDTNYKETWSPIVNAKQGKKALEYGKKEMVYSYVNSKLDPTNGVGGVLSLQRELKDPKFEKLLHANGLTTNQVLGIKKKTDQQVKVATGIRDIKRLEEVSTQAPEMITNVLNGNITLDSIDHQLTGLKNNVTLLESTNQQGINDGAIGLAKKQIKQLGLLSEIATYRNDSEVVQDPVAVAALQGDVRRIVDSFTGKGVSNSRKMAKDVMRQEKPGLFIKNKTSKANKTRTKVIEELYDVQTKILEARKNEQITDKTAQQLLAKVITPMTKELVGGYDRVEAGAINGFSSAYNAFDKFVSDGYKSLSEADKDDIRNGMVMDFMTRMDELGGPDVLSKEGTKALISAVSRDYAISLNPDFAGLKAGDPIVLDGGLAGKFLGIDPRSGRPVVDYGKQMQREMENS